MYILGTEFVARQGHAIFYIVVSPTGDSKLRAPCSQGRLALKWTDSPACCVGWFHVLGYSAEYASGFCSVVIECTGYPGSDTARKAVRCSEIGNKMTIGSCVEAGVQETQEHEERALHNCIILYGSYVLPSFSAQRADSE